MKKVKYVLLALIVLASILLIAAVFLPNEYGFQSERSIGVNNSVVYNLLANLDNRAQWDPMASKTDIEINETNNETLFSLNSKSIGEVRIESVQDKYLEELTLNRFENDNMMPEVLKYIFESCENSTTNIVIQYDGRRSWPTNLFNFFTKRKKAKELDNEFTALEKIAKERQMYKLYNGYKIVEDIAREKNFLIKRAEVSKSAMQQFYVQNLGVLFKDAQDADLEMDGMPSGLFYSKIEGVETLEMAAAIPVTEEVNIANASSEYIQPRKAIVVDYFGDYNNTKFAHAAILSYFKDKSLQVDFPVIEEYVTDPTIEKDPNKWLTKITYYIAE